MKCKFIAMKFDRTVHRRLPVSHCWRLYLKWGTKEPGPTVDLHILILSDLINK